MKQTIEELAAKAVLCDHVPDGACLECIVNFGQAVALATYEDAARICRNEGKDCFAVMKACHLQDAAAIQRRAEEVRK